METARCKAFVAAAESGSFTLAAEGLGYTPSGVSQLVNALEDEVGFPLLRRSNRGVSLTREGEDLLPVIRSLLQQEERLFQEAANLRGLNTGHITIASYSSIAAHWLPRVISAFEKKYPGISMELREGIRVQLAEWLNNNEVDVVFFTDTEDVPCEWRPLADVPLLALLPPDHPRAGDESFPLSACAEETFVLPAFGRDVDTMLALDRAGVEPHVRYPTVEDYSAMAMVASGLGVSIMNSLLLTNCPFELVQKPLDPPQHLTFGVAVRSWEQASPAVRKFCAYARGILTSDDYDSQK